MIWVFECYFTSISPIVEYPEEMSLSWFLDPKIFSILYQINNFKKYLIPYDTNKLILFLLKIL